MSDLTPSYFTSRGLTLQVVADGGSYVGVDRVWDPEFVETVDLTDATLELVTRAGTWFIEANSNGDLRVMLREGGMVWSRSSSSNVTILHPAGSAHDTYGPRTERAKATSQCGHLTEHDQHGVCPGQRGDARSAVGR